ncbi:hypothetical protein [Mesorhizobium erdmanii]|uniref:ABC transporter ATP-binding protein n=1 Tax=Mesorhizobium erdmanii TaxID=1777866 RepID=UPI0004786AB8|nr:hypothetical protein [Mesorhizobium erdmanii]
MPSGLCVASEHGPPPHTHDLPVAWLIADRIAAFYLWRLIEMGTDDDITFNPATPTSALRSATPQIGSKVNRGERLVLQSEVPSAAGVLKGCRFHPCCPLASLGKEAAANVPP